MEVVPSAYSLGLDQHTGFLRTLLLSYPASMLPALLLSSSILPNYFELEK